MDGFLGLSFSFFCGEGLSEIILCSRISWLCLKPLFLVHLSTEYMKTNEIYFKNHLRLLDSLSFPVCINN